MAQRIRGMDRDKDRKHKGRTQITHIPAPSPTRSHFPQELRAATNKPVTAKGNGNVHRGDRRDTSPAYSGNTRHRAHAGSPRRDVSTRAR